MMQRTYLVGAGRLRNAWSAQRNRSVSPVDYQRCCSCCSRQALPSTAWPRFRGHASRAARATPRVVCPSTWPARSSPSTRFAASSIWLRCTNCPYRRGRATRDAARALRRIRARVHECVITSDRSASARWAGRESARAGLTEDDAIQYWFTDIARPDSLPTKCGHSWSRPGQLTPRPRDRCARWRAGDRLPTEQRLPRRFLRRTTRRPGASRAAPPRRPPALRADGGAVLPVGTGSYSRSPAGIPGGRTGSRNLGRDRPVLRRSLFPAAARPGRRRGKAWAPAHATPWTDHRTRLAQHGQIWARDNLTCFHTPAVDWR
jgi:hypothetical protein